MFATPRVVAEPLDIREPFALRLASYMRAVLKPQSSVIIIAEQGEVKVVKSCARARSAPVRPKGRARLQF